MLEELKQRVYEDEHAASGTWSGNITWGMSAKLTEKVDILPSNQVVYHMKI